MARDPDTSWPRFELRRSAIRNEARGARRTAQTATTTAPWQNAQACVHSLLMSENMLTARSTQ